MKSTLQLIRVLIKTKFIFKKPKSSELLIFDKQSLSYLKLFLKDQFEIYYARGEIVNVYVLIFTLINNGLRGVRKNYKFNYFKFVNPKFIITAIDENYQFYLLKDQYKKPVYISFQRAFKTNSFFKSINKMKKENPKLRFKADYIFVLGKNDEIKLPKFLEGKFHISGNLINNKFSNIIRSKQKKIKELCFISSLKPIRNNNVKKHWDYKLFLLVKKFCINNDIKLIFLSKSPVYEKSYFKSLYSLKGSKYIPNKTKKLTYQTVNNSQFVVFSRTSLGHEVIAKGKKGFCFIKNFPAIDYHTKYHKEGFYWSNKINYNQLDKNLKRIFKLSQKTWLKEVNAEIAQMTKYDPNNNSNKIMLRKIFKTRLKKFFRADLINNK